MADINDRNSEHLTVSRTTKNLIILDCRREFLKHHPEFNGMKLSENFLIRKIGEYYLKP